MSEAPRFRKQHASLGHVSRTRRTFTRAAENPPVCHAGGGRVQHGVFCGAGASIIPKWSSVIPNLSDICPNSASPQQNGRSRAKFREHRANFGQARPTFGPTSAKFEQFRPSLARSPKSWAASAEHAPYAARLAATPTDSVTPERKEYPPRVKSICRAQTAGVSRGSTDSLRPSLFVSSAFSTVLFPRCSARRTQSFHDYDFWGRSSDLAIIIT